MRRIIIHFNLSPITIHSCLHDIQSDSGIPFFSIFITFFKDSIFNNDLDKIESHDGRFENAAGDIWQHRVNNPQDWNDDWVLLDE